MAGLPSVKTCMICHDSIATDRAADSEGRATTRSAGVDISLAARVRVHARSARALRPLRRTFARRSSARRATATSRKQTVAAAQRRSHDGVLRGLPPEQAGVERLPDVSLSRIMDRRNFIKLTAVTGHGGDARQLRQPRTPAHPLRSRRRPDARARRAEAGRRARCAAPAAARPCASCRATPRSCATARPASSR